MQNIPDNEVVNSTTLTGYDLAPQQRQVWQRQMSRSASGANAETTTGAALISYDAQSVVKLAGRVQTEALRTAITTVVEHHEILRTSFQRRFGMRTPVQVICEQPALHWREEDLTAHDTASQRREIQLVCEDDKRAKAADPDAFGAVLRVSLLRLAAEHYIVVLTLPTLCADDASLSLLTREISRTYDEHIGGEMTPGETLQYADFCEWQNELTKSDETDAGRSFWLNQQAVSFNPLRLPFEAETHDKAIANAAIGGAMPRLSTAAPARLSFTLPAEITAQLEGVAARCGVSTQTMLLACWQVLLWRLTARENFFVNCVFGVRHYEELKDSLGLFARALPLSCRLQEQRTLVSLAQEIEERCAQMSEWQEYYEGDEATQTEQIGFEYAERIRGWASASGLEWAIIEQRSEMQRPKLGLKCDKITNREGEARAEVMAEISYDSHAYTRADVERLVERMQRVIESAVENVEQTIADMPVVPEREWKYLVDELSQPEDEVTTAGEQRTIVELFEEIAQEFGGRVAVVAGDEELTYGELNRRANQLARFLRLRGVGADVRVALFMERNVDAFVALLAVLKSGGAFVPLNPEQPKERVGHQLADMEAPFVLTQERLFNRLPSFAGAAVCLDKDAELWELEEESNLTPAASPQHLAYVIYTSGSTGTPKGVGVTRQNLLNYTLYMCRRLRLEVQGEPLSFATVSTLAADLGHTAIFPSLVKGGCLHILSSDVATDGARFAAYFKAHPVDVLKIVPSHLGALMTGREGADVLPRKYLILGGEALSHQLVERLALSSRTCRIINHYGPTETTVGSLTFDAGKSPDYAAATVPVGRPIANTRAYVVDARGRLVPLGASGELYIGGAGLARGYLNQPAQTAERFIPDSFSGKAGARLYRTGDLVRQFRDGAIEFLGRSDSQVKIRGYRVELGEIEVALSQHAAVREVVVVATEDERQHKRLAAYIVASRESAPSVSELQGFLKERLPEYMLPSVFVLLDQMPLTPNGKLDRRALPMPAAAHAAAAERSIEAPRSTIEETLAEIWKQVLGVPAVGVHDNFFELGGDSIISIQIIARANQQGVRLTPKQLFQNQTIAQLAAVAKTDAPVVAEQGLVTGALPLTPVQHWFFEQNISEAHHWNQPLLFEVRQKLDAALLEEAVGQLYAHHDAVRLRFTREATGWQQFNAAPTAKAPFERVDLSALTAAEQSSEIERRAAKVQAGFDLSAGLLMRVVLFDCGADERSRLLLVIHHLAVDGVSWRILLEDLQTVYGQLARGESMQLPRKTTSFKRWAHQLAEHAQSSETRAELPFWLEQIQAQTGRLPSDMEGGENTVASAETLVTELSTEETRTLLQDVPAAFHTQINDALLTALAEAFARWTGATSSLIELEGHGREEIDEVSDLSLTVGWFTTHFPVVLNIQGVMNPGQALKTVKEHLRKIPRHGIGYGLLRYLCADAEVAAQLCAAPQPEVSFNYLGQLDQALPESALFSLAGESAGSSRSPSARRPFLLEVSGSVAGGRLLLNWTYSRNLHHRATIETLAEYFLAALRGLIAHSTTQGAGGFTPSDFPLAHLDQSTLDELTQGVPPVEDIYPLSPVQQGLLFHSLYAPEAGLYFEQKTCLLRGKVHAEAFQNACQQVVNRHTILRTAFMWQGLEVPLQVVRRQVNVPWRELDWRTLSSSEQHHHLEDFFKDDRARPFDPAVAPLMRMALIRLDEATHRFIWSHHHLLLDGWTMPILFREVFVLYEAFIQGRPPRLPVPRPYRDYIQWLARQNMTEAEEYWREALRGLTGPTCLSQKRGAEPAAPHGDIYDKQELRLSEKTSHIARALVRQHQLTINTLVQGMWALLLSHHSGRTDIVFGATVSGRPPSLEGVEHMVGLFINTLPVRARVRTEEALLAWLKGLQARQVETRQYEYTPLVKMQEWSDVPRELPLFENILVFDNYPIDNSLIPIDAAAPRREEEMFTIEEFEAFEKTNYPILVQAGMGDEFGFRVLYDRRLFDIETIRRLLKHFELLLESVIAQPEASLGAMLDLLSDFDRRQEVAAQQTRSAAKFEKFGRLQPQSIRVAASNES